MIVGLVLLSMLCWSSVIVVIIVLLLVISIFSGHHLGVMLASWSYLLFVGDDLDDVLVITFE